MSTSKPAFVLIHGAWLSSACWDKLKAILVKHGYTCVCPALPSSGASPPLEDFTQDVEIIRSTVTELVKDNKDVIVVMHSYGGLPGSQALEGLDKATRAEKGFQGGVRRLIYIMALMVPEGFQHSPHGTRDNMLPEMKTDIDAGIVTVEPQDVKGLIYQDLPDDAVHELVMDMRPQSLGVFWSKTTFAPWQHVPTTYVVCENDHPFSVAGANYLISSAQATEGSKLDTVVKRQVGHCPFLSQPEWTADMLREAAGEDIAKK